MSPRYSHWLPKESPHRALEGSMSPGVTPEAVTYSRPPALSAKAHPMPGAGARGAGHSS